MSVFSNLPSDSQLPDIGMKDPNFTSQLEIYGGGPFKGKEIPTFGKFKISKTDMAGDSSKNGGYGFMTNSETMKIQGGAPGNGNGSLKDNNGQGNSSGIPAAQPIDVSFYGDPNHTGVDMDDAGVKG